MGLYPPRTWILSRPNQSKIFLRFEGQQFTVSEDTEGEFRVSDPTKIDKSVVPLDTTDQHSNDKLECNVSKVATSKSKKDRKSKYGPNKIHASKHAIKRSKRGTLVDRGANGGMLESSSSTTRQ